MTEHNDPDDTAQYTDEFAKYGPMAHRLPLDPEILATLHQDAPEPSQPVEVPPALRGPAYTPQPTYTPPSPGWNGEPCEARRITAVVADNDAFPLYWAREFVGTRRNVVEVTYGGQTFYLDDEGDFGWIKVTSGGSPHLSHSNITIDPDTIELRGDAPPEVQGGGPDEDSCSLVDVEGETLRVRGGGEMSSEAQAALAEVVRAARKKMIAEQRAALGKYPYQNGDVTVLGPGVFASADGQVISWKGEDYARHELAPAAACRRMETRTCPTSYNGPCGDRPCARFESEDPTPWLDTDADEVSYYRQLSAEQGQALSRAETSRAEAQRDRDQHAAVLNEVLATFVHRVPGYRIPRVRSGEVDVVTLDKWRSRVVPTVERPWWEQVAEARADELEMRAVIERVRERCQSVRHREGPGGMINASQILGLLSPTWPDGNHEAPAPSTRPLDDEDTPQVLVDRPFRSLRTTSGTTPASVDSAAEQPTADGPQSGGQP